MRNNWLQEYEKEEEEEKKKPSNRNTNNSIRKNDCEFSSISLEPFHLNQISLRTDQNR